MAKILDARVRQKKDTLENWMANPLVLLSGEQAFVVEDDGTGNSFKIGDGVRTFADLPWFYITITGEKVVVVDTVSELKALPAMIQNRLVTGLLSGVQVNGYYAKDDTPAPIMYYYSETVDEEDGGSVFELSNIKVKHDFVGEVDVKYYGAIRDTDCTNIINKCIENNSNVVISDFYLVNPTGRVNGVYTGGVKLKSNSSLRFKGEGKLKSITNSDTIYSVLTLSNINNVNIYDANIEGDVETHTGTTGEWGHGISVYGCQNINFYNATSNKCWGDGIAIATLITDDKTLIVQNENINIYGTLTTWYNRRNGTSIISCDGLYIQNIDSRYTGFYKATAPSFGVDIEPNPSGVDIINCVIDNIYTAYNKAGGVEFVPAYFQTTFYPNGGSFNCKVKNIVSEYDGDTSNTTLSGMGSIRFPFVDTTRSDSVETNRISGVIEITNLTINNPEKQAIYFSRCANTGLKILIENVSIINPHRNTTSTNRQIKNAISFVQQSTQTSYGDVEINNLFINDYNNNLVVGVYLEPINTTSNKYKNVSIKSYNHIGSWSDTVEAPVYCNGSDYSVYVMMNPVTTLNVTTSSLSLVNQTCVSEMIININSQSAITLPNISVNSNKKIKIHSNTSRTIASTVGGRTVDQYINVNPRSNQNINILGESYIELVSSSLIWKVISDKGNIYGQGFPKKGTTAQRPTLTTEFSSFTYYDTTLNKPIWWSGTAWIDSTGASV